MVPSVRASTCTVPSMCHHPPPPLVSPNIIIYHHCRRRREQQLTGNFTKHSHLPSLLRAIISFISIYPALLPSIITMAPRGRSGGRIPAHERVTDDTTRTITATGISKAHQRAIFATSDQCISARVRKDYRLRIRRFVNFIFTSYPDVYKHATVFISQEQCDDPGMYFYPQDIHDLTYSGLDISYFLAFLSEI